MRDRITILQSSLELRKVFRGGTAVQYPRARFFSVHTRHLGCLDDLEILIRALNEWPHGFVIRGELIGGDSRRVERRSKGSDATFRDPDNGHHWVCVDVDNLPYWGPPESADSVAHCIRESLPGAFHGSSCVYQWSASAGVDGWQKFKLHLWFWLERPVCRGALRDWLTSYPIDPVLFRTVQPHYTSAPLFIDCEDPVSARVGRLPGGDCVVPPWTVPTPELWREAERQRLTDEETIRREARELYIRIGTARVRGRRAAVAKGILDKACKRIIDALDGQRHDVIYREAAGVGNFVGSGLIGEGAAVGVLVGAAFASLPGNRHAAAQRTIHEAIADGMKTPRGIDGV